MKIIKILKVTGGFAENKDIAKKIRVDSIVPALERGTELILDFKGVESVTQSFIHVLLSEVIREFDPEVLDKIAFKNCNDSLKGIIEIVVDYMQI